MTDNTVLFLGFVVCAFAMFMIVLAYVSVIASGKDKKGSV